MSVKYISTRGGAGEPVCAAEAIVKGQAHDGGLYAPTHIPKFGLPLGRLAGIDYTSLAVEIFKLWLSGFSEGELRRCAELAYGQGFSHAHVAPVVESGGVWFLELFHGRTLAFKDMALSVLPHLLTCAKAKSDIRDKEVVILAATSGDTGKAAMAGFADVAGTRIIVFYPKGGVSEVQRLQMVTQEGANTHAVSVTGNFDDAQTGVKKMFTDEAFNKQLNDKGFVLSSANSINIGRLVPQIVYYFYAYGQMLKSGAVREGELVDFVVPTGNFGNILAGWYAREMGLPVGTLICASNSNNVLADFFETGEYNKNREFVLTSSPSMDILISSNLERLLFELSGKDAAKIKRLYENLGTDGVFRFDAGNAIAAGWATEPETFAAIKKAHGNGYTIDTHTAVAYAVCEKIKPKNKTVVVSTASPYKFGADVLRAINGSDYSAAAPDELFEALKNVSGTDVPHVIKDIARMPVTHTAHCGKDEMENAVNRLYGGRYADSAGFL